MPSRRAVTIPESEPGIWQYSCLLSLSGLSNFNNPTALVEAKSPCAVVLTFYLLLLLVSAMPLH